MGKVGQLSFRNEQRLPDAKLPLYASEIPGHTEHSDCSRWRPFLVGAFTFCAWLVVSFARHGHVSGRSSDNEGYRAGYRNPAYLVQATHGAVAAENKRCSDIGVQIMQEGGNAVDAAIGATFCTGVVNMFSSGIGGGGLMTVRIPPSSSGGPSEVFTIDFREVAPALANASMYHDSPNLSRYGGLAVAVPGEVLGLEEAHRRWAKLSWQRLIQPSINLAEGWQVDRELGRRIPGPIGDALVRKVRATGGILSHADLENYSVIVRPALEGTYRGKKIYTTHAPTSGPVRMDEIPTKKFAESILSNITDDRTHAPDYYNPEYDVRTDHGTSHTSVVDKDGMAVSLTTTVNLVFGSQVLDPETGILLNDEMDDFSTPGISNGFGLWPSPSPGKRPLSSTTPSILEDEDGSFFLALGGSGGSRIFGAVFQVLFNLELGLDLSAAIEFGRLHDQLYPLVVDVNNVYPQDIIDGLRRIGHNVTVLDVNRVAAVIQAVAKVDGKIFAASDSRKNGIAAGY
ncbi:hypothetical protein DXG01_000889 [Tephrocybe rancida]|nr:hypothetical protein DXG01_000889 [Tephrocybe rancida]